MTGPIGPVLSRYTPARKNNHHHQQQTTGAIAYLHSLDPPITHRDISINNIFIEHQHSKGIVVKLGDFGVSKEGKDLNTNRGARRFRPPEFGDTEGDRIPGGYTKAVDVWSLGVVIVQLLYDLPILERKYQVRPTEWCEAVLRRATAFNSGESGTETTRSLGRFVAKRMLCINPEKRWEADRLHEKSMNREWDEDDDEEVDANATTLHSDLRNQNANALHSPADVGKGGVTPNLLPDTVSAEPTSSSTPTPRAIQTPTPSSQFGLTSSELRRALDSEESLEPQSSGGSQATLEPNSRRVDSPQERESSVRRVSDQSSRKSTVPQKRSS